jgi:predicted Fe-Mo cluster-binding NifX family protein
MKVAVTSTLPTLDAPVAGQLHRSKYLLTIDLADLLDPDTMEYTAIKNPLLVMSGPEAGELFTRQLFEENVWLVLAGSCSSDIMNALGAAGIQIMVGMSGSVRRALIQFAQMSMADTSIISFEELQD